MRAGVREADGEAFGGGDCCCLQANQNCEKKGRSRFSDRFSRALFCGRVFQHRFFTTQAGAGRCERVVHRHRLRVGVSAFFLSVTTLLEHPLNCKDDEKLPTSAPGEEPNLVHARDGAANPLSPLVCVSALERCREEERRSAVLLSTWGHAALPLFLLSMSTNARVHSIDRLMHGCDFSASAALAPRLFASLAGPIVRFRRPRLPTALCTPPASRKSSPPRSLARLRR